MTDHLEGTDEFNRRHREMTGQVPVTVTNSTVDMFKSFMPGDRMHDDDPAPAEEVRRLGKSIAAGYRRIAEARRQAGVASGEPLLGLHLGDD